MTLIEGDGIGPEISQSVKDIFSAANARATKSSPENGADFSQAPIKWDPVDVTPQLKDGRTVIPDKAIDSVKTNYIALKGPLAVPFSTLV